MVLDESHNCKNYKARQTHVIDLHKRFFDYRYLLTGTPTPNHFGEIYAQMKILDSSLVPRSFSYWIPMVAKIGNRFSKYAIDHFYDEEVKKWEKIFSPWISRYTSDEILDLPELYIDKVYAELPEPQLDIYQKLIEYIIFTIKETNDGKLTVRKMVNKFPYISMALDNPLLLKGKIASPNLARMIDSFSFADHGKLEIITSLLQRYIKDEKRKVVVFDYHPLTIDMLANTFSSYNPLVVHGQNTPKGKETSEFRDEVITKFRTSKKHNLLIASSKVLSTAIELQEATRAIYFSRDYSYLSWSQSQKRLHRIGQDQRVVIHPLIFEDSLDVRLDNSLEKKQDLDRHILSKDSLSMEEWRFVFEGRDII